MPNTGVGRTYATKRVFIGGVRKFMPKRALMQAIVMAMKKGINEGIQ